MAEPHLATGKSYPVWVGCLKDSVTDSILEESFCFVGGVVSCKVMVDERGKSRYAITVAIVLQASLLWTVYLCCYCKMIVL